MSVNPKIFKAYDIRGLAPGEIDEDAAFKIGQAFVRFTGSKTVVTGKDMRESTPRLFEAFAKGVMSQGADVVDIGLVSTPMFYFAVGDYELHDGGAMVTASHNPKQYNGFKLCFGDVLPIGAESGMNDIKELVLAGPYDGRPEGTVVETTIREAYLKKLFSLIDVGKFRQLNVVVDTGNGMEGIVIEDIFRRLPSCKFSGLFLELDGGFPNHEANPLKTETLEALQKRVHALKADIGVAYDGDADRIGLVDENGVPVRGDILLALLAPRLLARAPGAAVIYDVRCSMIVPEQIEMAGGRPVMWKVGHGLIKPKMRLEDAVFAGELSQHYYFRDLHNAENTDLVMLMVFELMSETGKKLSELVAPLMRYHHSGEINFQVEDKAAVLAKLEEVYGHEASAIAKIDGLRVDFRNEAAPEEDWWFSVRASNTEPLLRLNLEAKSKEKMEAKKQELIGLINS